MTTTLPIWVEPHDSAHLSDGALLEELVRPGLGQKGRAEWAMRCLVERHSPMVLAVCQRSLGDRTDAEDATQAVFMVLWKKADQLLTASIVGWLHRTATWVCRNAIRSRRIRRHHEFQAAAMNTTTLSEPIDWAAVREVLDAELDQLPDKYRLPLIMFHLEERSLHEIAMTMSTSEGTIGTWLVRAREMLSKRLLRRGLMIGAVALAVGLTSAAQASPVAPTFVASTVTAASLFGTGQAVTAGGATATSSLWAGEVLQGALFTPIKWAIAGVVAGGVAISALVGTWIDSMEPNNPPQALPAASLETPPADTKLVEVAAGTPAPLEEELDPAFGGVIGQVVTDDPIPEQARIDLPALKISIPDQTLIVDPQTRGVQNVFIFMKKPPATIAPQLLKAPTAKLVVDNVAAGYVPHAFIARAGQPIVFKNANPFAISVHTFSAANQASNFSLQPMDRRGITLTYAKSESLPIRIVSDIHPWMSAYLLLLDHPYAAVTDAQGRFHINHLPVGTHSFRVWHERAGYIQRDLQITITGGEMTTLPLRVISSKFMK